MAQNNECGLGLAKTKMSLASEGLSHISSEIILCAGRRIQCLDLSHNDFQDLAFLERFPALQTLVLDHNRHLDCTTLPLMEHLRSLSLNNNNLVNITDWLNVLQEKCPHLEELSMMVGDTELSGGTEVHGRKYRKHVIRALPRLTHIDGVAVTEEERRKALKSPKTSLFGKVFRQKLGHCKHVSLPLK